MPAAKSEVAAAPLLSASGRVMRLDAQRNRERIFRATRLTLEKHPYDASIEQIAEAAGLGVATIYRHFPRRLDLLEAVYREDLSQLSALAGELRDTDPWDALVAWLGAFVKFTEGKRALNTELGEAFQRDEVLAAESRRVVDEALGMLFDRAVAAGAICEGVVARDLIQLVGGMNLSILIGAERNDAVLEIVLRGIRA